MSLVPAVKLSWSAFTRILTLTPTELSGQWHLFVLVSSFLHFATCAWLSWSQSAFGSMLNSSVVSYALGSQMPTCLTVREHLHLSQSGWLSPESRYLSVTRVWPMRSLLRITASRKPCPCRVTICVNWSTEQTDLLENRDCASVTELVADEDLYFPMMKLCRAKDFNSGQYLILATFMIPIFLLSMKSSVVICRKIANWTFPKGITYEWLIHKVLYIF